MPTQSKRFAAAFEIFLVILILVGVIYRFAWANWSQGSNLHPDEYGLTNTLTQLRLPNHISEYFNTRLSPLSPYNKYDFGGVQIAPGPDNRMRWGQWPIIIIRWAAEQSGQTDYDELRLLGRRLSALADTLTLLFVFLIGQKLYDRTTGLLATALSGLAVMQIQQSHFMTVDNFGVFFTMVALYACVQIAHKPYLVRPVSKRENQPFSVPDYQPHPRAWLWFGIFGIALGMALASRINLLPLTGMILVAVFVGVANLRLKRQRDLVSITGITLFLLMLAAGAALLTFRITHPMAFRSPSGDTYFFTLHLNKDWTDSMAVAQSESNGIGGGPPAEQWAHRPAILFPLVNMVLWGMGLPLGIMSWTGFGLAIWRVLHTGREWQIHLIPLFWTGGYFVFMGTRWVKSIRYFLPIYPFLCLLAAWGLLVLWQTAQNTPRRSASAWSKFSKFALPLLTVSAVLSGTLIWATSFVNAVYLKDHTRIQATNWIIQNIPAPFHLELSDSQGVITNQPIAAPDWLRIGGAYQYIQPFTAIATGHLQSIVIPHARMLSHPDTGQLRVVVAADSSGETPLDEAIIPINGNSEGALGQKVQGAFRSAAQIEAGKTYYLIATSVNDEMIVISRSVIANEHWDEGLPLPLRKMDPFGQFYRGLTMEVRRYDDESKRTMFLETLAEADVVILPSQRGIWSTCRLPLTYPMTIEYYRALFEGRLGFELAALFTSPLQVGPLWISDVGGTAAWGEAPDLPLFNNNLLAAEEAFSVYDHPPVWIFVKGRDFDIDKVKQVLFSVDLSQVVIQSPREATGPPCR